jgi:RNA polymerase sigma-B factor
MGRESMTTFAVPASTIEPQAQAAVRPVSRGENPRTVAPGTTEDLLRARRRLPVDHPDRAVLRARAIEHNLPFANRLARRYAGHGERFDDLQQVAALALVKAVDGYDPDRLEPFVGYAVPTIVGALKRHFRDTAWGMRVPRSTQELLLAVPGASGHLTQVHGRPPTLVEVADRLRVTVDVLLAAVGASQVYRLPSLNAPATGNDDVELIDLIGATDPRYADVDDHLALGPLVAALPAREQRILIMRFYDEMTQSRIAAELGLSQMHVSRLLRRSLKRLKSAMLSLDERR